MNRDEEVGALVVGAAGALGERQVGVAVAGEDDLETAALEEVADADRDVERQSLLECSTAEQRTLRLCELVEFKTAEARLGLDASRQADS